LYSLFSVHGQSIYIVYYIVMQRTRHIYSKYIYHIISYHIYSCAAVIYMYIRTLVSSARKTQATRAKAMNETFIVGPCFFLRFFLAACFSCLQPANSNCIYNKSKQCNKLGGALGVVSRGSLTSLNV